jgi:hypothetical protein
MNRKKQESNTNCRRNIRPILYENNGSRLHMVPSVNPSFDSNKFVHIHDTARYINLVTNTTSPHRLYDTHVRQEARRVNPVLQGEAVKGLVERCLTKPAVGDLTTSRETESTM